MVMKLSPFFKLLKRKIDMYDKAATNPFTNPQKIVIVWVEDSKESQPANINLEENN